MHEGKTDGPAFAAAGALSLTHNNIHANAYRLPYSCPTTHLHPRAHAPRETREEYRVSLRQSASVEPC
jgi:hypothetical protein